MKNGKCGLLIFHCSIRTTITAYLFTICSSESIKQVAYRAAVVEYAPKRDLRYFPREILAENAKQYEQLIGQAASKGANIIVFPECGLTTLEVNKKVPDHLKSYGIEIPAFEQRQPANPCKNSSQFHKVLVTLSCAAKNREIYVVINLLEKEVAKNNTSGFRFYSTNLVFDKNGYIIKKYRKINLHDEEGFSSGNLKTETFRTDFGVTFGLLIGADIFYQKPAGELITNLQVTDVIHSSAWSSETPFFHGLSVQHGYAKANEINLLSAGLSDPVRNSSGSGIFVADGNIAEVFISGAKVTKLIVQDVPATNKKFRKEIYRERSETSNQPEIETELPDLQTTTENMQNYTFEPLDLSKNTTRGCSKFNNFCCFNIRVDPATNFKSGYTYKLVSFFGTRNFGSDSRNRTIAVRVCALVACLNESSTSCGLRNVSAPEQTFESVLINTTFGNSAKSYFQPTTLKYNLLPVSDYAYCERKVDDDDVEYLVKATKPQNSLLTFGIFGRIYDFDNQSRGRLNYTTMTKLSILNTNNEDSDAAVKVYVNVVIVVSTLVIIVIVVAVTAFRIRSKLRRTSHTPSEHENALNLQTLPGRSQKSEQIGINERHFLLHDQASSSSTSTRSPPSVVSVATLRRLASDTDSVLPKFPDQEGRYDKLLVDVEQSQFGQRKEVDFVRFRHEEPHN